MAEAAPALTESEHQIQLTPEAGAAVRHALNRIGHYEDRPTPGQWVLDISMRQEAIYALEDHVDVLEGVVGRATLFDPNDRNVDLEWARQALEELEGKP